MIWLTLPCIKFQLQNLRFTCYTTNCPKGLGNNTQAGLYTWYLGHEKDWGGTAPPGTGEGPSSFSINIPSAFIDHNAPQSVRMLFTEWVKQADATDNGIITINRYTAPYSHTTVDKAIKWLISHRLMMKVQTGRGRGNGAHYFVRWSFKYKSLKERQKSANLKNGNLDPSIRYLRRKNREEPLKDSRLEKVAQLTQWLKDAFPDRLPSEQEKRKLSAAVRLLVSPKIADPLLADLWWRKKAPLRLWRDAIGAIWNGVFPPENLSDEELTWRVRRGLKNLLATGDRQAFKAALEAPVAPPPEQVIEWQLRRNRARWKGERKAYREWKDQALETGVCPWCGKPLTRYQIEEGLHPCVLWWRNLEEDLAAERRELEDELFRIREERELFGERAISFDEPELVPT